MNGFEIQVWLDVFKAMLGEVGVFQDLYDGSVYEEVATVLLVVYLLVVAVMLLNLLIAVLRLVTQTRRMFVFLPLSVTHTPYLYVRFLLFRSL